MYNYIESMSVMNHTSKPEIVLQKKNNNVNFQLS